MEHPFEEFGSLVFDDDEMQEHLPKPIYKAWQKAIANEQGLDRTTADAIAHAIKLWAMEKGATHFTHWFQPMTGSTAEKHNSFIDPDTEDRHPFTHFSGKSLIKDEPDASSFPSGGLRGTFEARGYTYWDVTSPVFIRKNVLYIPTVFVSYNGESLDKKGPLLKSIHAVSEAATKVVNTLGDKDVRTCRPMAGLEQEYFLIDRKYFEAREDLRFTGRTLFGAPAPKSQELEDHYFGEIPARVQGFMNDLNKELWKLGIYAKTEHNEAAPGQFELAAVYCDANRAVDENQLVMETMQSIAAEHGMACLLTEKPFYGINGSGKHANYSLITNTGLNLFSPGDKPAENVRFLVFICAFLKAVDEYAGLLRLSAASASCDYRLGGNEAPPVIISVYLGEHITGILDRMAKKKEFNDLGKKFSFDPIYGLSYVPKDNADRNRTSPVAFTGNKFEFRMVGSAMSGALPLTVLNTTLAQVLNEINAELNGLKYLQDIREKAIEICTKIYEEHKRILFNGDGYSKEWAEEAARRGLPNLVSCVDTIDVMEDPKVRDLFTNLGVYSDVELDSRRLVFIDRYINSLRIEAKTLMDMCSGQILPMMSADWKNSHDAVTDDCPLYIRKHADKVRELEDGLYSSIVKLQALIAELKGAPVDKTTAARYRNEVMVLMADCRDFIDRYEMLSADAFYTIPKYEDMLFDL